MVSATEFLLYVKVCDILVRIGSNDDGGNDIATIRDLGIDIYK